MTTIHTLGPVATDSNRAAKHLQMSDAAYQSTTIALHPSFEFIYEHLNEFTGDLFLVPVAYQAQNGDSWSNNNYRYWNQLTIKKTFHLPTLPMLLAENQDCTNQTAIIHAATKELLTQFETTSQQQLQVDYVTSKPLAQSAFEKGQYQYAIFSKQSFVPHDNFKIIQEYHPAMIWCLYQINPAQ